MIKLTRRAFGAAAISAPVALSVTTPLAAKSTAVAEGAPGYGATFGSYRVTALLDGILPMTTGWFPTDTPETIASALSGVGITGDQIPAPINAFVLQSDTRTILVDAGLGGLDMMGPGFGRAGASLGAMGIMPADIDTLVMTHAHPDHIGGMLGANGAAFPNAELIVTGVEHGFWTNDAFMAQAPEPAKGGFQLARAVFGAYGDRLNLVEDGAEIAPGVTMELAPGHTMGHALLHVDGGDRQLLMLADTVHNVDLQTVLPQQGTMFDTDPAVGAETRARLFDRVAADRILTVGCHVHFPSFGRIVHSGAAFRYVPATIRG